MSEDYRDLNRANWDDRAPVHAASADYGLDRYRTDPDHLSDVVRFDRERLGDLTGVRGVHLQCHLGTDTLSLARLGAEMTGLDFSAAALERARGLAGDLGLATTFVESDLYGAPDVLPHHAFDLVYTGIGALCWLPDVRRWAEVVATLLAPGGRLFLREGHPMLWALADPAPEGPLAGRLVVEHPYVEIAEPTVWDDPATYVETGEDGPAITHTVTHEWNHGLGETITALLDQGLTLTTLVEHDTVPWDALPGLMEQVPPYDEWRLRDRPWRLPHTYTLVATAPGTPSP